MMNKDYVLGLKAGRGRSSSPRYETPLSHSWRLQATFRSGDLFFAGKIQVSVAAYLKFEHFKHPGGWEKTNTQTNKSPHGADNVKNIYYWKQCLACYILWALT